MRLGRGRVRTGARREGEGREGSAPEDAEDLVNLAVAGHERQARGHLGKDGRAGPDVDLCVRVHVPQRGLGRAAAE